MKLAALGVITVALGIGLGLPGLIGIGAYWVLLGPAIRQYGKRLLAMREAAPDGKPPIEGRTFAYGTLLWALLAVPSLLVGLLCIGIDGDNVAWRWLPVGVGAFAAVFGGLAAILYLLGNAGRAFGGSGATPSVPATLRIRAVRETGTYINERARLEFDFQVEPDAVTGLAPYPVTKKATVPVTAIAYLRIGEGFRALVVGPEDPTTMEIHWDQPVTEAP